MNKRSRNKNCENNGSDLLDRQNFVLGLNENTSDNSGNDPGKKSYLEKGVVVNGSITSVTSLIINGAVKGSITCEGDVVVNGNVAGNINAATLVSNSGHVRGNIACGGNVMISGKSLVHGDISGTGLDCTGRIEGNANISGLVHMRGESVIIGDIKTERINIDDGASINGKIIMQTPKPCEDETDDMINRDTNSEVFETIKTDTEKDGKDVREKVG